MKEYKLKDIAKIISGGTAPKENFFDESIGIPFIRAGHLEMLCNGNSMDYIPKIKDEKLKGLVKVPKDTIVFAKSGMSCMKARVYKLEKEAYIVNHLVGIICDELVEPNYLKYYFKYNKPNKLVLDSSYPSIRLSDISEIRIKLPSNEIQLKVSNILDKAQNLIDKRKEQLEALDELVKSKFIEMFGDPITNSKEWNTFELREGIKEIKYGTSKPPIFSEEGIPFVRATNIKFGRIIENDMKYISEYEAEKIEKCKLSLGDTIIVRSGANTGDNAFVSEEYVGSYGGYDIIVKLNEKINYIFLNALLNSIYRETIIQPLTRRAGQPHLNSEQIQSLVIYNPPIELQNQFADFVKQVDKLKFEIEKSLKELEDNFNSLMQKAFKGKLFK
ncbi:restriction endonuclease subunit S [Clostridium perfringens]